MWRTFVSITLAGVASGDFFRRTYIYPPVWLSILLARISVLLSLACSHDVFLPPFSFDFSFFFFSTM